MYLNEDIDLLCDGSKEPCPSDGILIKKPGRERTIVVAVDMEMRGGGGGDISGSKN